MNNLDKERAATQLRTIADSLTKGEVSGFVCGVGKPDGKLEVITHFDAESYNQVCDCCGKKFQKDDFEVEVAESILKNNGLHPYPDSSS